VLVVTGAGDATTGAELVLVVGDAEGTLGAAWIFLITTVFTIRRAGLDGATRVAFGPSAGSAPRVICQERPTPRASVPAAAKAATLAVRALVEGRLGRDDAASKSVATLGLAASLITAAPGPGPGRGARADRRRRG